MKDYSIDLEKQKVLVTSSLSAETVKEVVEQTGRTAGMEIGELSDYYTSATRSLSQGLCEL